MKDSSLKSFRVVAPVFLIFMSGIAAVPNEPIPINIKVIVCIIGLIIGLFEFISATKGSHDPSSVSMSRRLQDHEPIL